LRNCGQRSVALRCISNPDTQDLSLALIAAVRGKDPYSIRAACLDFSQELEAAFPQDYFLSPAIDHQEFQKLSGWELIYHAEAPNSIVEIERSQVFIVDTPAVSALTGEWLPSKHGNELIWRALATSPTQIMLTILIQPTLLLDSERSLITELAILTRQRATACSLEGPRREAEWMAGVYERRSQQMQYPYLLQIHLVAVNGVPPFTVRLVGGATTLPDDASEATPGFRSIALKHPTAFQRHKLLALEPIYSQFGFGINSPRLRIVASLEEVSAVLRLPYISDFGLPGVSFTPENT